MNNNPKKLVKTQTTSKSHWVGDGFPVRTVFSPHSHGAAISPFLMLDYAGPAEFPPSDKPRGVEEHPHKGFETVTIVYAGEVEHRDSAGGGGLIGPGDVQWMTAASGLVHEEMHGREFTRRGGILEMIQLWVNLPAKDKHGPPRYQSILAAQIPEVALPNDAGIVRVIAGTYGNAKGPARSFTPINLWDVRLHAGKSTELPVPDAHNTMLFALKGDVELTNGTSLSDAGLALFEPGGKAITLKANADSKLLLLDGAPIHEPVAAYGPFVMNTEAEIHQAVRDYQSGRMGTLSNVH